MSCIRKNDLRPRKVWERDDLKSVSQSRKEEASRQSKAKALLLVEEGYTYHRQGLGGDICSWFLWRVVG